MNGEKRNQTTFYFISEIIFTLGQFEIVRVTNVKEQELRGRWKNHMLGETDAFVLLYYQCVVQAGGEEGGKNTRDAA